jgi:hypothetical protein
MPKITLDDIRQAADEKFGPLVIEGIEGGDVELLNPARLSKQKRHDLKEVVGNEEMDEGDRLAEIVKITARSAGESKRLLSAFKEDVGALAVILESYNKGSQMGEASPSAS